MKKYAKFFLALLGAAALIADVFGPGNKWAALVIALATAFGVYQVPNRQGQNGPSA